MSALTDLMRDIVESGDALGPRAIADEMVNRIPHNQRASVLAEVLPVWVSAHLALSRMLSPISAEDPDESRPATSSKVAAVRDDWRARLNTQMKIGDSWKRFADCTAPELRDYAANLRSLAQKQIAKAEWYEGIADHIPPGGTVSALSREPEGLAA